MELDHFKTLWKEANVLPPSTTQDELEQMLAKKSQSPIAKIKRNLLRELIAVLILYTATTAYYFIENTALSLSIAWMLVFVGLIYIFYYVHKSRLLKKMECNTCEVKSNLSTQLTMLEKYIKIYLWAGTLMVPLIMIFMFITGYFYMPETDKSPLQKTPNFFIIYLVVCFVFAAVLTFPLYFLNKWYVHKLYGQHVKKLRALLNEMNEVPFQ